jgi:hypothetical protein
MVKFVVIYFLLLISTNNLAQNKFIPFVNQSGSANKMVSWSLGETSFTTTLVSKQGFILTGGFLQPTILNTSGVTSANGIDLKVIIGPNPIRDYLTIICHQLGIVITGIQVTDVFGQTKIVFKGPYSGINFKTQLPFVSVNTGVYFISIFYIADQQFTKIKVYKVVKT